MKKEERKQTWNFVYDEFKDGYAIVGIKECGVNKQLIIIDGNDHEIERLDVYCIILSEKESPYIAEDKEAIEKIQAICEEKRREFRNNISIE